MSTVHSFKYFIKEGIKGIKANLSTAIGSIITIFLSLFLIGIFVFANAIVGNVTSAVEDQVAITAYISDEASADEAIYKPVQDELAAMDGVSEVQFTTKDQAMENFRSTMKSDDIVDQLDGANPLPASFTVILSDPQQVEVLAEQIQNMESFQAICDSPDSPQNSVKYGQKTVERLFSMTNIIRTIAVLFVLILIFVAFVFMNNTIKLAVTNRSKEIGIQRLVGASNAFIRGPFLAEGAIHATIGAVAAIIVLQIIVMFALPAFAGALVWLPLDIDAGTIVSTYLIILVAGLLIGLASSALAMRKYLKV